MAKLPTTRSDAPSGRVEILTPEKILQPVRRVFGGQIVLDPAGHPKSLVSAAYTLLEDKHTLFPGAMHADGLKCPWTDFTFVNPPYGRWYNKPWAAKAYEESKKGISIIAFVPANLATGWWGYYWKCEAFCLLNQRVKHVGEPHSADFDQAVVYFGKDTTAFEIQFRGLGKIIYPDTVIGV